MKLCNKCLLVKNEVEFNKDKYNKDGLAIKCRECTKIVNKKWREDNKEYKKIIDKKWREDNKDKVKITNKYYRDNQNKDDVKNYNKNYYNKNKSILRLNNDIYKKSRKENDSLFKLTENIRTLISNSFRNNNKSKSEKSIKILGCSFEEFKFYLESKFEDWMTWENRGLYNGELNYGWDIDHIIPTSSAETEEEIIRLNHYTNLQPLCSQINRNVKKNKLQNEIY